MRFSRIRFVCTFVIFLTLLSAGSALSEDGLPKGKIKDGLHVYRGNEDLFYWLKWVSVELTRADEPSVCYARKGNTAIYQIAKDQNDYLVTLDSVDEYSCYPVVDNIKYCIPDVYEVVDSTIVTTRWNSSGTYRFNLVIEDINGINAYNYPNYYGTGRFRFFSGELGEELTLGYYEGVKYTEEVQRAEGILYILGDKFTIPTIKTKDGYFVVDISDLDLGLYAIKKKKDDYYIYLFEVVAETKDDVYGQYMDQMYGRGEDYEGDDGPYAGIVYISHSYAVNVRTGAGTDYPPIDGTYEVLPGQEFTCLGIAENGWYCILLPDGRTGFISNNLSTLRTDAS